MSIHIITYECIKFNRIYSIILYENGIYTIINKNYK